MISLAKRRSCARKRPFQWLALQIGSSLMRCRTSDRPFMYRWMRDVGRRRQVTAILPYQITKLSSAEREVSSSCEDDGERGRKRIPGALWHRGYFEDPSRGLASNRRHPDSINQHASATSGFSLHTSRRQSIGRCHRGE
jgi:hypothetical protein